MFHKITLSLVEVFTTCCCLQLPTLQNRSLKYIDLRTGKINRADWFLAAFTKAREPLLRIMYVRIYIFLFGSNSDSDTSLFEAFPVVRGNTGTCHLFSGNNGILTNIFREQILGTRLHGHFENYF